MKIFCVGRNYSEHAKELNNAVPDAPVIFCKPETALLKNNEPFFLPDFSADVHHELELVIRICRNGKRIEPRFAHKYYDHITVGIDFTARDLQQKQKEKGLPWEIAKAFDGSAPLGSLVPLSNLKKKENIHFHLLKNGERVQEGNSAEMLFNFDHIISYISTFFTLKTGDLIYTGTPAGVGKVLIGDKLEAFLEGQKLLHTEVK
ncbi:MAG: fumarylacetoacetate hydrolase family protein [Bacteroidia bacterium]|nr:fumarylacetoacetate hydrolase family protein [Bacteroidia bacterium]